MVFWAVPLGPLCSGGFKGHSIVEMTGSKTNMMRTLGAEHLFMTQLKGLNTLGEKSVSGERLPLVFALGLWRCIMQGRCDVYELPSVVSIVEQY